MIVKLVIVKRFEKWEEIWLLGVVDVWCEIVILKCILWFWCIWMEMLGEICLLLLFSLLFFILCNWSDFLFRYVLFFWLLVFVCVGWILKNGIFVDGDVMFCLVDCLVGLDCNIVFFLDFVWCIVGGMVFFNCFLWGIYVNWLLFVCFVILCWCLIC